MADKSYDLIVIGGGPGGYVAAIRAGQLGMTVACIDKRSTLGGTCLNVGCIPSKALLQSSYHYVEATSRFQDHGIGIKDVSLDLTKMMARKSKVVEDLTKGVQFLFKKYNVDFIEGTAQFVSPQEIKVNDTKVFQAKNVIIATGSDVVNLPGIQIDEKKIVSSTGCLELKQAPEHLVVIGGGYIGLELGSVWQRLGSKVTVIEFLDRIVPSMDQELGEVLMRELKKQGIEFMLSTKVTQIKPFGEKQEVTYEPASGGKSESIVCDVILSSVGRKPYTEGLGLEVIGIQLDDKGRIPVDDRFKAGLNGLANVYAIGDVIAGPMLAHKAQEEGSACVEYIAGQKPHLNYDAIPAVIYTHPEVASVGKTEEWLKEQGIEYKVGKFPFTANARARTTGDTEGFVKILANAHTDEVLGAHIIHSEAGTMIAECALALEYRASAEDIARTCHAHPTLSEAIKEAAMAAYDKPIHI